MSTEANKALVRRYYEEIDKAQEGKRLGPRPGRFYIERSRSRNPQPGDKM